MLESLFLIEFVPNNLKTSGHRYLKSKSFLNPVLSLLLFVSPAGMVFSQNKAGKGILRSGAGSGQHLFMFFFWFLWMGVFLAQCKMVNFRLNFLNEKKKLVMEIKKYKKHYNKH